MKLSNTIYFVESPKVNAHVIPKPKYIRVSMVMDINKTFENLDLSFISYLISVIVPLQS